MRQWIKKYTNMSKIDFYGQDGCLYALSIQPDNLGTLEAGGASTVKKTDVRIVEMMAANPSITTEQLAERIDISQRAVLKQINKLKEQGRICRVGPDKGGIWQVLVSA